MVYIFGDISWLVLTLIFYPLFVINTVYRILNICKAFLVDLSVQVLNATRQVIDRIPTVKSTSTLSTLFLQLTVDDMGICVPVTSVSQVILTKNFNIV